MAQYDACGVFDLVVEELSKILHVHLALLSINNGSESVENSAVRVRALDRLDNVGKLANSRGLDEDSVGSELGYNLLKRLCKVAYKRATNASRIHLVYLNSRFRKKSAVDAYLTELVFNENDLLATISLFKKLFNKCCFSRA